MVLPGAPGTAEDVIRFFQGYDLHAKSVTFLRENEKAKVGGAGVARWS